jgi:NhaP-type Na+/H+ and K+/H+ antiporter
MHSFNLVLLAAGLLVFISLLAGVVSTRLGLGFVIADLPLVDVCAFFQLPMPQGGAATLRDWLTDKLARDAVEGDGIDWQGAHFRVIGVHEGHIARVGLALAPKAVPAS